MKTTNMLGLAISIAAQAHEKVTDRGGNAYILHPIRLMMRLRTKDQELMQMAILHDVVEDCSEYSLEYLASLGFSDRVIAALDLLTHKKEDSYDAYIDKIATNKDAILIKIQDLRDNADITRLKGVRDKDIERLKKYHHCYIKLSGILDQLEMENG